MNLCDTCRRPPSERSHTMVGPGGATFNRCTDPIHDLADRCVELEAEIDLRDSAIASEGTDEGVRQLAYADQVIVGLEAENNALKARLAEL